MSTGLFAGSINNSELQANRSAGRARDTSEVWNPPILIKQKYLLVVSHVCGNKSYKVQRLHQGLPQCCLLRELHRVQQCPHHPANFFLFGTEVRILVWPGTSEGDQHGGGALGRRPNCQPDPTRIHDLPTTASGCLSSAHSSTSPAQSLVASSSCRCQWAHAIRSCHESSICPQFKVAQLQRATCPPD